MPGTAARDADARAGRGGCGARAIAGTSGKGSAETPSAAAGRAAGARHAGRAALPRRPPRRRAPPGCARGTRRRCRGSRRPECPPTRVRRAVHAGRRSSRGRPAVLGEGAAGLARFSVQLFQPVLPMLADTADDEDEALAELGEAALEYKLDGARVQVHKGGDEVRVYSRRLNDVTARCPSWSSRCAGSPPASSSSTARRSRSAPDGTPHPFQVTMRRFGRRLDVERLRDELPLSSFFFDLLYLDGELAARRAAAPPRSPRWPSWLPAAPRRPAARHRLGGGGAASSSARRSARGHEGIMAKSLDAPYEAGRRGRRWLKVKPAAHARPRRARGGVGPRPPARAGSATCTSARAIRTPAASSCSARRSRE